MEMADFEYDGELLSDYGCIIANYVTSEEDSTPLGMKRSYNTVKVNDIDYIASSRYDEVLTKTFDIIRDPCMTDGTQKAMAFSDTEVYRISKWLQKGRYLKFKPLYNEDNFVDIVFYGVFEVRAIRFAGDIVGFTLTLTTNAPYAFNDPETIVRHVDKNLGILYTNNVGTVIGSGFDLYNNSQEIGYIYPDTFKITCYGSGTLKIKNTKDFLNSATGQEQVITEIKNCVNGETITMDCKNKIIDSDKTHKTLYNDFNYHFPRLIAEYEETVNRFVIDLSTGITGADVEVIHSSIRKVGII